MNNNQPSTMKTTRRLTTTLSLLALSIVPDLVAASEPVATEPMSRQTLLKREIQTSPGSSEARVIRVTFPPGFKTPLHTHDGQGPRYVLKGKLRVEDHGQIQVYGAGDVFWETGAEMTVENVSGSDAEMVIFEIAPAH